MIEILTDELIRYEADEMTNEEEVAFFQKLIDSGMAWTLQGHYGRVAEHFIGEGLCTPKPANSTQ
jgi:hypothetical protein